MTRRRHLASGMLLVLASAALTGCFGRQDINDMAMVMAVGVDKGKAPGSYVVTAQVARPADAVGQTGAPTGNTGKPVWTVTAEGQTLFDAVRELGRFSSRRVYWAHNKIIVISEQVARRGIGDVIDFFTRNHELRMRTWVAVTPELASDLLSTKTGLQVIPGDSIDRLFRYSQFLSEAPRTDMRRLEADYLHGITGPVLPRLSFTPRGIPPSEGEYGAGQQVQLFGAAAFHGERMVTWLSPDAVRGAFWFTDHPHARALVVPCDDGGAQFASLEVTNSHFTVMPLYKEGKPSFDIDVSCRLNLVELGCYTQGNPQVQRLRLQKRASERLLHEIMAAIRVVRKERVDILHLGETFDDKYPAEWARLKGQWERDLPTLPIAVHVRSRIDNPVLLAEPTRRNRPAGPNKGDNA